MMIGAAAAAAATAVARCGRGGGGGGATHGTTLPVAVMTAVARAVLWTAPLGALLEAL